MILFSTFYQNIIMNGAFLKGFLYTGGWVKSNFFKSKKRKKNIVIVNNLLHNHEKHLGKCTERLACKRSNQKKKDTLLSYFLFFFFRMDSTLLIFLFVIFHPSLHSCNNTIIVLGFLFFFVDNWFLGNRIN